MKYSEAQLGRVFIVRLEDGEILHEEIETFARNKNISAATVIIVGGADKDSILVVGPEISRAEKINPMELILDDAHEMAGAGTIFPDKDGNPVLHVHAAFGRGEKALAGCVRKGIKTWHVLEVVITEIINTTAKRLPDKNTGFELMVP